ncbi:MAG: hypothetical protein NTW12_11560 [Deltaproteobacteria bacterium]|nr:hypothetical protein [Deltaproteobacteria bacterium]
MEHLKIPLNPPLQRGTKICPNSRSPFAKGDDIDNFETINV